jgi:hypothetical protein
MAEEIFKSYDTESFAEPIVSRDNVITNTVFIATLHAVPCSTTPMSCLATTSPHASVLQRPSSSVTAVTSELLHCGHNNNMPRTKIIIFIVFKFRRAATIYCPFNFFNCVTILIFLNFKRNENNQFHS